MDWKRSGVSGALLLVAACSGNAGGGISGGEGVSQSPAQPNQPAADGGRGAPGVATSVTPPAQAGRSSQTQATTGSSAQTGSAGQPVAARPTAQMGLAGQAGGGVAGNASSSGAAQPSAGVGMSAGAAGVSAGPAAAACDPADKTDPPEVIQFDATKYTLFENGAKNYEPSAVTGKDTPNTGPYEPLIEVYPAFDQFTVYRPKTIERLMPIIAWGNGGCAKHGTFHGEFMKELASYGFLAIADGAPGPKDSIGLDAPMSPSDGTQQKKMLDWAIAENERPCSVFYHKLDTSKVAVAGNSCGGLMTMYAAPDPRVTTAVLFNSGLFSRDAALYDSLHAPMAIFDGGPEDAASDNGRADVAAIDNVPILFANDKRGHGSYLWDDNAGPAGKIGVAWFSWFLLGEQGPNGKGMFVGDDCGMCTKKDIWPELLWKNEQLLK